MSNPTDTELKIQGVEALIDALGEVMAEKFITLISREPFDYTEWQKSYGAIKALRSLAVWLWLIEILLKNSS